MPTTTFFTSPTAWHRLHAGPLGDHVDDFADWLADQGYARSTGRRKLRLVGGLSRWLADRGLDLPALDDRQLERFRTSRSRRGEPTANVMFDGRELLTWLRGSDRRLSRLWQAPPAADVAARERPSGAGGIRTVAR